MDMGQRNRFYRSRKTILAGVPEQGCWELVKMVEVSEWEGTRKRLIGMNREVRLRLFEKGLVCEDCFSVPMKAVNGNFCMRGLVRLEKAVSNEGLLKMLRVVWIKRKKVEICVKTLPTNQLKDYIREVMLETISSGEFRRGHLAMSKGWRLKSGAVSGGYWFHGGKGGSDRSRSEEVTIG